MNPTKGPVNLTEEPADVVSTLFPVGEPTKEPADVVPTSVPVGNPTKELTVIPNQLQIRTLENFPGLPDGCSLVEFLEIRFSEMKSILMKSYRRIKQPLQARGRRLKKVIIYM